ncbi:uncharacterized protein BJ171DRAFT_472908 [Polychytrium aggregatum]|uniref:uncharacterized protein n=1 Tax=Polychytrium aggregatum TaxID=110093 RepID=UPI0022FDEB54|nr:uncharacterized protein BJ171DRAFT_472908 [Polychytrium aggregatum]KAI9206917.1 hypothetical protein BJ171DRAFT_472908 [Polychytrium aggregatum]
MEARFEAPVPVDLPPLRFYCPQLDPKEAFLLGCIGEKLQRNSKTCYFIGKTPVIQTLQPMAPLKALTGKSALEHLNDPRFSNVVITLQDDSVYLAHSAYLERSPFFRTYFRRYKEPFQTISLSPPAPLGFADILRQIYMNGPSIADIYSELPNFKVILGSNHWVDTLRNSEYFRMNKLMEACYSRPEFNHTIVSVNHIIVLLERTRQRLCARDQFEILSRWARNWDQAKPVTILQQITESILANASPEDESISIVFLNQLCAKNLADFNSLVSQLTVLRVADMDLRLIECKNCKIPLPLSVFKSRIKSCIGFDPLTATGGDFVRLAGRMVPHERPVVEPKPSMLPELCRLETLKSALSRKSVTGADAQPPVGTRERKTNPSPGSDGMKPTATDFRRSLSFQSRQTTAESDSTAASNLKDRYRASVPTRPPMIASRNPSDSHGSQTRSSPSPLRSPPRPAREVPEEPTNPTPLSFDVSGNTALESIEDSVGLNIIELEMSTPKLPTPRVLSPFPDFGNANSKTPLSAPPARIVATAGNDAASSVARFEAWSAIAVPEQSSTVAENYAAPIESKEQPAPSKPEPTLLRRQSIKAPEISSIPSPAPTIAPQPTSAVPARPKLTGTQMTKPSASPAAGAKSAVLGPHSSASRDTTKTSKAATGPSAIFAASTGQSTSRTTTVTAQTAVKAESGVRPFQRSSSFGEAVTVPTRSVAAAVASFSRAVAEGTSVLEIPDNTSANTAPPASPKGGVLPPRPTQLSSNKAKTEGNRSENGNTAKLVDAGGPQPAASSTKTATAAPAKVTVKRSNSTSPVPKHTSTLQSSRSFDSKAAKPVETESSKPADTGEAKLIDGKVAKTAIPANLTSELLQALAPPAMTGSKQASSNTSSSPSSISSLVPPAYFDLLDNDHPLDLNTDATVRSERASPKPARKSESSRKKSISSRPDLPSLPSSQEVGETGKVPKGRSSIPTLAALAKRTGSPNV